MKKFEQINKHMNANKTEPINKKSTIDFLPVSKFLHHIGKSYDDEVIVKFFASNNITLKDFYRVGACDEVCVCGKNDRLVWRNDFMYYDILNKCLINVEDDEELEDSPELEQIDFAVYVCPECGAWSTLIS
ncbi:hypothetical protein [Pelosinus sp. UFO1]|uniref:hypothetical protein n=1 Tax=Pelosinus sp. UFO1 TaxID=484770 RepID=UPI0004D12991|nr:hypothetical protein [Pelosinus sp. UFO1]AIF51008.1 hypothetical protein UFO1_1453 [Pelosinus sp. UFO1]